MKEPFEHMDSKLDWISVIDLCELSWVLLLVAPMGVAHLGMATMKFKGKAFQHCAVY